MKKILYVETGTIEKNVVELDAGEFLGDLLADIQEQTISEFPKVA